MLSTCVERRPRIFAGTSGWAYKSWRGEFYPAELKPDGFLRYYAGELGAVEVNNTFYRMPQKSVLASWSEQTPPDFRFALKVSRRITHFARLRKVDEPLAFLLGNAAELGQRLGPLLLQLPPNFTADLPLLRDFLRALPRGFRLAFEPRHTSWLTPALGELFREVNVESTRVALCLLGQRPSAELEVLADAADFGYLRLREEAYSEHDLDAWSSWIDQRPWKEAYVFFKHEDAGSGPLLAKRFAPA
jgi:uncharacterized protein YecE (DUF72 family)